MVGSEFLRTTEIIFPVLGYFSYITLGTRIMRKFYFCTEKTLGKKEYLPHPKLLMVKVTKSKILREHK